MRKKTHTLNRWAHLKLFFGQMVMRKGVRVSQKMNETHSIMIKINLSLVSVVFNRGDLLFRIWNFEFCNEFFSFNSYFPLVNLIHTFISLLICLRTLYEIPWNEKSQFRFTFLFKHWTIQFSKIQFEKSKTETAFVSNE